MTDNFNNLIAHVTGGRRYCFVLMSYHEGYTFFEKLRKTVAEVTGFECIRADDLPGAGEDLRMKIHYSINNAVFIIGDVSDPRPNIYYELGYAIACNRPVLLIAREGAEIHTDLKGLEMISYKDTSEGWENFERSLRKHLKIHIDSNISLLRAMILPPDPKPSIIIVNPKPPQPDPDLKYRIREFQTYGDYLGLSGIMSAFASAYGEHVIPEIVTGAYEDDSIINWDTNLFLIGSPKVNRFTEMFLSEMQHGKAPGWHFEKCPGEGESDDFNMKLTGRIQKGIFQSGCKAMKNEHKPGRLVDYGLIMRGSHPRIPGRTVLILAGSHSLGTGAACLAATKTPLIQTINEKLAGKAELTDRNKTIWVLAKGKTGQERQLEVSGVSIVEAGVI